MDWHIASGENSPFVAACMNSLALLLDSSGRSNEAKGMFERCVAICKVGCQCHVSADLYLKASNTGLIQRGPHVRCLSYEQPCSLFEEAR